MSLQVYLLGRFEVRRDGIAIGSWRGSGARQLLKVLAVEPRHALSSDAIGAALWPSSKSDRLPQRVHHLTYLLRAALEPGAPRAFSKSSYLQVRDHVVRLVVGNRLWIDADEFERQLDAALPDVPQVAPLERALDLYQGPLLPDDSSEDWLIGHRVHLEKRYLTGIHALIDRYSAANNHEGAIALLQRLLRSTPADERAHRELITLYGRVGRQFEAERQFAECKAALARELAVSPSDETRAARQHAVRRTAVSVADAKDALKPVTAATPGWAGATAPPAAAQGASVVGPPSVRYSPPAPLVRLLGREELVSEARALLLGGSHRLLSLTGVGGIGKTQVAIRLASEVCTAFRNGACFVSLAEVGNDGVLDRIRQTLGLVEDLRRAPGDVIVEFLRDKHVLLVLDNFEHVLDSAGLLPGLLQASLDLSILTTSRRRLNLAIERVVVVRNLDVCEEKCATSTASALALASQPINLETQVAAVQLFAERARWVVPRFRLTASNVTDVQAITRQLEGVPLAIELAAARSVLFDPSELRKALRDHTGLVSGGGSDRPARHRSLNESLAWSYSLLSVQEQDTLQHISLFSAPFETRAATAICNQSPADVSVALQGLVDAGLVMRIGAATIGAHQDGRFRLLETTKAFARSRLNDGGQLSSATRRFAAFFAELAVTLDAILYSKQADAVAGFRPDEENFYAALDIADSAGEIELLCRLVRGLGRYWGRFGAGRRASRWVEHAISNSASLPPADRGWLHYSAGVYWGNYANFDKAKDHGSTAIACAYSTADLELDARASTMFATTASCLGDIADARDALLRSRTSVDALAESGLKLASSEMLAECYFLLGDLQRAKEVWSELTTSDQSTATIYDRLSIVAIYEGEIEEAINLSDLALQLERSATPRHSVELQILNTRIALFCRIGDAERAEQAHNEARAIISRAGADSSLELVRQDEGIISLVRGEATRAAELLARALEAGKEASHPRALIATYVSLIWALLAQANFDTKLLHRTLAQLVEAGQHWPYAHPQILEAAAAACAETGRFKAAARAWTQADALRNRHGSKRFPVEEPYAERTIKLLDAALGSNWRSQLGQQISRPENAYPLQWVAESLRTRCPPPVDSTDSSGVPVRTVGE